MKNKQIIICIIAVSLFACSPGEFNTPETSINDALPPSQPDTETTAPLPSPTDNLAGERKVLTYQQLTEGFDPGSPVDDGAFAMPADALPAEHVFEGRLELIGENTQENIQVLR